MKKKGARLVIKTVKSPPARNTSSSSSSSSGSSSSSSGSSDEAPPQKKKKLSVKSQDDGGKPSKIRKIHSKECTSKSSQKVAATSVSCKETTIAPEAVPPVMPAATGPTAQQFAELMEMVK